MKQITSALLATALWGALMASGTAAQAQEKKEAKPEARPAPVPARPTPAVPGATPVRRDYADLVAQRLQLSDEQKQKVRPIFEEEQKSLADLRQQTRDKKLTPQEYREKAVEIREAANKKIKPILTDEQWERFSRLRSGGMRPTPASPPQPAKPEKVPGK